MLKPSMQELMKRVGNRYLLVNLAAQRARDLADQAQENDEVLPDKTVKLALDEIADGSIVYCPGPRASSFVIPQNHAIASAIVDVDDMVLDDEEDEELGDLTDDEETEARSLTEFDDGELGDGDVPEEDR